MPVFSRELMGATEIKWATREAHIATTPVERGPTAGYGFIRTVDLVWALACLRLHHVVVTDTPRCLHRGRGSPAIEPAKGIGRQRVGLIPLWGEALTDEDECGVSGAPLRLVFRLLRSPTRDKPARYKKALD